MQANDIGGAHPVKRAIVWTLCFVTGLSLGWAGSSLARQVDVIRINYREARSLLAPVKAMLSDQGVVSVDEHSNSLVVVDQPDNLRIIRQFIQQNDFPAPQAKVTVRFMRSKSRTQRSTEVYGDVSGKEGRIRVGRANQPNSMGMRHGQMRQRRQGDAEFFILVSSGSRAYIKIGQDIPFTQTWVNIYKRHASVTQTTTFKQIETGFEVTPIISGGHAVIEITPRISSLKQSGGPQIIRFAQASTRVRAPLGKWVAIGGGQNTDNEVIQAILAQKTDQRKSGLTIMMKVEKN